MAHLYGDQTTGPPMVVDPSLFFQYAQADGYYGLNPTLQHQQEDYLGRDATSFDLSMYIDQAPDMGPVVKRSASSSDGSNAYLMHPAIKKARTGLQHMDSDRSATSSGTAHSTATSNQESSNESRSPPSDNCQSDSPLPEPSQETYARQCGISARVSTLPRTAAGQTPSVLLPYNASVTKQQQAQDYAQLQQARATAAAEAQQRFQAVQQAQAAAAAVEEPVHSTRRSKVAALQHLGEVADEEDESARVYKSKPQGKRQTRKKSVAVAKQQAPRPSPPEVEDDETISNADGDEEKRAQFLERNRLAACKSRQKKKEWIKSLEDKGDDLTRQNSDLQVLVTALRDEIVSLRSALANHAQCSCRIPTNGQQEVDPSSPEPATFAAAPWAAMSPKEGQTVAQTPGVIEFHPHSTGLTPFMNSGPNDTDYFSQSFSNRPAMNTPELARSLGYTG